MFRIHLIFIILILSITYSIAQAPDTLWTKTFGGSNNDYGWSVQQTTDSGYIITGYTSSFGSGSSDIWLIKTDSSGDTLWTKTFGGTHTEQGYSVQQTTDGGYIIVGKIWSVSAGTYDVWLIKTDASGDTLWTKAFGESGNEQGLSVQQTTDLGFIIVGTKISSGGFYHDVWLIKTDTSGDTIWTKTFGGDSDDECLSIRQTEDEGYIIAGSTASYSAGTDYDVWLIKTDASGDTLWTKTFGGSDNDYGSSVQQTTDGGFILIGETTPAGGSYLDIWLIKTDASGDTLWTKTFDRGEYVYGTSVQQTTDGGYIITGHTSTFGSVTADVLLIKTNSSGDTLWTKIFGGSDNDEGNSVQKTTDGGFIITGWTSSFGAGSKDVWLIKTTPDVSDLEPNTDLLPLDFSLHQNYPNPFNPSSKIKYSIPERSNVSLKVFDLLGSEVAELVKGEIEAGTYDITFNASNLPSGIYFYQIRAGDFVETKKMVLMK
jgi:hypothetical protein